MNKMRKRITFEQKIPDVGATDEQITEWVQWIVGYRHDIQTSNPLCNAEIDAELGSLRIEAR